MAPTTFEYQFFDSLYISAVVGLANEKNIVLVFLRQ